MESRRENEWGGEEEGMGEEMGREVEGKRGEGQERGGDGRRGGRVEAYGFGAEAPPTPNQRHSFTCCLHGLQGRIVVKLCLWLRVGLLGSPMTNRKVTDMQKSGVTDNRNYRQDNL